jgi:DNA invertase Pin-like site-specific DNA recombinase
MQRTRNQLSNGSTVIGYVRVSTEDQAQGGVSLEAQRRRIEAYCAAHGLVLTRVESDAGISTEACVGTRPNQ